jgi:hypothetical protein
VSNLKVCAALFVLIVISTDSFLSVNTCVMICDCGGGTTDLTSYKIVGLEPRLKLDEAATGTGRYSYSSIFIAC